MLDDYKFSYSATLRIMGENLDLDNISINMNITPTHTHKVGEKRNINSKPYDTDFWSLDSGLPKYEALSKHIDHLWSLIKNKKNYLITLKEKATVDVFLSYTSDCETAGIEIPYESLVMFNELKIPIGISIIVV